jgi:hypothetical protein
MHKRLHSQSDRQHLGKNAGTRESRLMFADHAGARGPLASDEGVR